MKRDMTHYFTRDLGHPPVDCIWLMKECHQVFRHACGITVELMGSANEFDASGEVILGTRPDDHTHSLAERRATRRTVATVMAPNAALCALCKPLQRTDHLICSRRYVTSGRWLMQR